MTRDELVMKVRERKLLFRVSARKSINPKTDINPKGIRIAKLCKELYRSKPICIVFSDFLKIFLLILKAKR